VRKVTLVAEMVALILVVAAPAFAAVILGDDGSNNVEGTPNPDTIRTFGGHDIVEAKGGGDNVNAGNGQDIVVAAGGDDVVVGGLEEDNLTGGAGDDTIYTGTLTEGDKQSDEVSCASGLDTAFVSSQDHASHNLRSCEEIISY
jgi:Ca2+-binding RTX toxin-like protein